MFFHPNNLKSENNNPWYKPWFNILLHTSQCLEYLGCITLDEKVALEEAGSIITVTAGDPDKEKEMKEKFEGQKCQNHEKDDYFCCEHTSKTDQKPKYGKVKRF